ncbi:MAG: hypothetical protein HYS56_04920 [Candidatus Omnitrophica bacterium]|nr:hypothetical protein [Candidatus Omnitrophota bacterium]
MTIRNLTRQDQAEVIRIHCRNLPESPFVQMGEEFLSEIYYPTLLKDKNTFCLGCEWEGKIAGFICGTVNALALSRKLVTSNLFIWPTVIGKILSRDPRRIGFFLKLIRFAFEKSPAEAKNIQPQLLSFAIDEEFRSAEFFRKHSVKIANEIFHAAVTELKQHGVTKFKVITDRKNIANIFYRNMGMKMAAANDPKSEYCLYIGDTG